MVKRIKLTQGKVALVDDEDYKYLRKWKWHYLPIRHDRGYAVRTENRKNILMHRQIMKFPSHKVDHHDGDGLNNRKKNIRKANNVQNAMNMRANVGGTSKYKGVCWHERAGKWMASIQYNKKKRYLGIFHSEDDAAKAYNQAAIRLAGEYARLNIIGEKNV